MLKILAAQWALLRALVLAHLQHEKARSLLTLMGVALGVAVVVAMAFANEATMSAFRQTVASVAGRTELEVLGRAGMLDERLLGTVLTTPGVEHAVPRVSVAAAMESAPSDVLTILGVDVVNDAWFRDYNVSTQQSSAQAAAPTAEERARLLDLIVDPRSILLTRVFAQRHGLDVDDLVTLTTGSGPIEVRVAGLLEPAEGGATLDGNIAIMDIAPAQDRFALRGRLSGIDVIRDPIVSVEELAERLRARLPAEVKVQRPEQRGESVEKMLAAFRLNLTALSSIALAVGMFLIYNTVSISVVRRREEIGTLRALGAARGDMLLVFLGEGLLFGVVGSALGVAFGTLLADSLLAAMNQAVAAHWLQSTARSTEFNVAVAAGAAALGVGASLLAALLPALEAANVPPANTMRAGSLEVRRAGYVAPMAGAGVCTLALAWFTASLPPLGGLPVWGFVASFLIIVGFALMAPAVLMLMCRVPWRLLERRLPAEPLLALAGVDGSRARTTVAVTGLMIGLAMVVGLAIMVGSFRSTVVVWLGQTLQAELYVQPVVLGARGGDEGAMMPLELEATIAAIPGVSHVDGFRMLPIEHDGRPAYLGSTDLAAQAARGRFDYQGADASAKVRRAVLERGVVVSEPFAYRRGLREGDTLTLALPGGTRSFTIHAVYTDYASDLGFVVMHRDLFLEFFPMEDRVNNLSIYLEDGVNAQAMRERLLAEVDFGQPVIIMTSGDIRRAALDVFDKTFAITNVLMVIAMLISILGITTTLLSMILDRQRELTTLRFLGMDRDAVGRVVMYESALLALAGLVLGLACGGGLSLVLIHVINLQSFGWTIQMHIPYAQLALACAVLFVCTLLAGVYPAREAGRTAAGLSRR